MPGQQLNLLCIDGGGVKGLSALYIIGKLMEFINPDDPPKPCDYFDMIGGTSTGGLIAIMLGRLEMSVGDCIEQYIALQDKIFRPVQRIPVGWFGGVQGRYNHVALEEGVKALLRSRGLEEDALLKDQEKKACKVFVTATSAGSSTTDVLASYYRRRGAAELYRCTRVWEAARATSAASTFFESIDIGLSARRFRDGGTGANNPVFTMWKEASDVFCGSNGSLDADLACLVSVGCGIESLKKFGENAPSLVKTLAAIATETEATARHFLDTRPLLYDTGKYHRFSAPSVGDIDMDKPEEKSAIAQMTDHYIGGKEIQDRMTLCASKLSDREIHNKTPQSLYARQDALVRSGRWSSTVGLYQNASPKDQFDIFNNMSRYDPDGTRERLSEGKCHGTTTWILDSPDFCRWLGRSINSCFALTGIVGSGKTTCTTTVVDFLQDWTAMEDRQVFHFFYESLFQDRLTATDVLEAFIKQIILTNPDIPVDHHRVWKLYGPQSGRPHIVQVAQMLFIPLVSRLNKPIFVIDGLDECEQHSRQELIELLPSIITAGSSFFISTRDVSQLTMRFPNIVTIECSINEEGVRLDLETFVSDSIQRQNRKQKITDDEVVLRLIRTTLLEKAKAMFLWAKLLVIDIWTVCNDVTQIKDYLENGLPAGLEETYARCRKRVHPSKVDLSKDLFEIVCGAVEPFYIDELRTILALGEQDGKLIVRRSEPLTDILLRDCGANLIVQSKDGHVLPIHHSVQQYVFPQNQIAERRQTDPGLERVNVELHIGLICMLYLQQRATQTLVKKNTKPSGTVYGTMSAMGFQPYKFLKNIVEKPSTSPKQVAKAPIASEWSYTNNTHSQSLLPYAQRAWVQSNRYLAPQNNPYNKSATSNRSWNLFCHLVSEYREGVTYPWPRFQTFHLHGLFTWAVTHQHRTLIAVLTSPPRVEIARKLGLFNKPLLPPQDGFALHYAATSGQTDLFYNLWHHCDVWKIDNDGNTALHLGAMNGRGDITSHYEFSRILPRRASGPESRQFLCNRRAQNPLHMAIIGKNHACVAYVMKFACFVETQSVKSLNIKGCLSSWILAQDDDGNTSADLAVIHGSHEFIIGFIVTLNMDIHFSQPLNGTDTRVRVTANVARKAIQLQRWDLLKILINRRERLSCPFTPDNPFPHPTLPITQSLLYDIVLYRSDWIPELLSQAWYFEDFALRQAILSFALGNDVLSTRTQDVILLQICQAISPQSKGDFRDAMRQSTEPPRNVNWLSVLLAEAITNHTTEAFDWAIRGARALNPFVIYEAARQGDLRSIKVLLQTNQWRKDTLLQAAKFAVDRCHVEAFLLLRQNNETPPMTKDWLLTIANLESSTRRPDRFSSDIRMQLRSLLSSTSISGSLTDRILWHAAALGLTKLVAQMLNSEDAEINYRGDGGTTALWQAARHGHWETIHELLDCGANAALTDVVARSGVTQKLFWRSPHSNRTPYQVSIIHGTGAPGSVQAKAVERLKLAIDELDSDDLDYNYEASGPPSPDTNLQEDSSAQGPD